MNCVNNYYNSEEECLNHKKKNTNDRYKNFCQIYFTAGDYEQFNENRCYIPLDNTFKKCDNNPISWSKYKDLDDNSVENTFQYFF